jgi:putative glutamine amidotransferase
LIHEALERGLPILGVCRGAQILNVALGGSLRQDIADEVPDALDHRNCELYEHNEHEVRFSEDRWLESLYGRATNGVVEAFRDPRHAFCVGVQWHPEFIANADDGNGRALSARPIADAFRRACVAYRAGTAISLAEGSVRSER